MPGYEGAGGLVAQLEQRFEVGRVVGKTSHAILHTAAPLDQLGGRSGQLSQRPSRARLREHRKGDLLTLI